jgi:outer membrane protein
LLCAAGIGVLVAPPALAESLEDALALVYTSNPSLQAERASLRASDESLATARADYLPDVSLSATQRNVENDSPIADADTLTYSLSSSYTLYNGGARGRNMDSTLLGLQSARNGLRATEQALFVDTVSAYVNVIRDEQILDIRTNNLLVLEEQLRSTNDRFDVGAITYTDVAQAESRVAGARTDLASAQANLRNTRAAYESVVGQAPGTLDPPPDLPLMPQSLSEALDIARENNTSLISARISIETADIAVRTAQANIRPSANVSVSQNYNEPLRGPLSGDGQNSTAITGTISVPLFSGGARSAALYRARENASAARLRLRNTERTVDEQVTRAWANYETARLQIETSEAQVRATELAFEGVRDEGEVGDRTTLDVLNAEQELRSAQLSYANSVRNAYVNAYQLLATIGVLTPEAIGLDVEVYDPDDYLDEVRRRYLGIGFLE